MKPKLPPALEAEYKWLKRQVDRAQDEAFRRDANKRAGIALQLARTELSAFVSKLRKEGFEI